MAEGFTLNWRGSQVAAKMSKAAKSALEETGDKIADDMRENTPRDTGRARSAIGRTNAQKGHAGGWTLYVGETKARVHHLLILEIRNKMLRRAKDTHYPALGKAIAAKFRNRI